MARRDPYRTNTGIHIEWFTVRRRTVFKWLAGVVGLVVIGVLIGRDPPPPEHLPRPANRTHFLYLDGTVEVRKANTFAWVDATIDMELAEQDMIRTRGNSEARLQLLGGTMYVVQPRSVLLIEVATETSAKSEVEIQAGTVDMTTPIQAPPGSEYAVSTPEFRATVKKDSEATVGFEPSAERTELAVWKGEVEYESDGKTETLKDGEGVEFVKDRELLRFALMQVPVIVSPEDYEVVSSEEPAEFRWRPVDGARKYRVVLDRSPEFPDPLLDSTVSGGAVLHPGLEPGTYYWKVSAIGHNNRPGAPSVATFVVRRNPEPLPPRLAVAEPTVTIDGLVTLRGQTDADCAVTITYGDDDVPATVSTDGSFMYRFLLNESGRHSVTVRSRARRNGGVAEKKIFLELGGESK